MTNRVPDPFEGPQFLGIGAPRCGTTWLYEVLRGHPALWLPPIKELHYFDSIDPAMAGPYQVHLRSFRLRRGLAKRAKHYVASPLLLMPVTRFPKPTLDWRWDARYFGGGGDIAWYRSLFADAVRRGLLGGEITPSYFALRSETIEMIRARTPVRRLILMLRDPVEAMWSFVKKDIRDGLLPDWSKPGALLDAVQSDRRLARFSYADNLERWLKVFDRDEIFVGGFDDLQRDSQGLLRQVCSFLDVDHMPLSGADKTSVNTTFGVKLSMSDEVHAMLTALLAPQRRKLDSLLGSRTVTWN